jgi:hypothetical protein
MKRVEAVGVGVGVFEVDDEMVWHPHLAFDFDYRE